VLAEVSLIDRNGFQTILLKVSSIRKA
jgi:hypothetical protein